MTLAYPILALTRSTGLDSVSPPPASGPEERRSPRPIRHCRGEGTVPESTSPRLDARAIVGGGKVAFAVNHFPTA
jgi:hypothetical protein